MAKISAEILISKGFHEYTCNNDISQNQRLFQKKVTDKIGVRYFINCTFTRFGVSLQEFTFWEFDIQISTVNGAVNITTVQWFNNDGKHNSNNLKDVDRYFDKMWKANGKHYYEIYSKVI